MLGRTSPTEFAALPLEAQLDRLKTALKGEDPRQLLALCASLRDLAPLGFLSERLWQDGFFAEAGQREFFARFLVAQPEMTVHRLLRALVGQLAAQPAGAPSAAVSGSGRAPAHLRDTLLRCLQLAPLARLTSMCLIDRALKHHFPTERDQAIEALVARTAGLLDRDRIEELSLDELAQLPGRAVPELRDRAAARSAETLARFDARRAELAAAAITVLAEIPKAVSQANAEDLLSRRVYTDPGHFLVELLQNAEDAGARTFRVRFERTRLCIWHDGAPFDARDLVGVTSIGQTTKRKQQIGFFGVGFKSVYEITDRPQVFSDVYRFEIADVSLPRPLASRPPDLGEASDGGTLLVLPLRQPDDRVRSAAALYQKARAIDPCVLFTLRSISALELELHASAGGPSRHAVRETPAGRDGRASIRQEPDGWERSYLLQDDEYRYEGGLREAGRPDSTRLLIGVRVAAPAEAGGAAVPQPLPDDAATVYSYLPTAERSGLRFFVQGHFDVPVDRERISGESPWNRWIISKVPVQISRLLLRAATQGGAGVAAGLLDVLPLGREISSPLFRSLPAALRLALWETPILPGLDGETRAPCETLIATPQIAALLGSAPLPRALLPPRKRSPEEIDPGPLAAELHLLDPGLPERSLEVAQALGCERLDAQRLLGLLGAALGELPAGARPPPALAPLVGSPERLALLFDLFLSELEALDRRGHSAPARELLGRLRALPLLLDEDGGLHRADARGMLPPARGPEELRAIYRGLRPLLHPQLDETLADPERALGRTAAMLSRLHVELLTVEGLVRDLEALLGHGRPPPRTAPLLAPHRHERTLALLAAAPAPLQRRACSLPILPGADGGLYPVARSPDDASGLCAPAEGAWAEALHAFYAGAPLVRPLPVRPPSAAVASLLAELGAPPLGLLLLLADLERDPARLCAGLLRLRELHRLLEAIAEDLPERGRRRLETLPIWPDRRGIGRPLRGSNAVYLPTSDEIAALVPTAPLLDTEVCGRRHVRDMHPQPVTAWLLELIEQLARPGHPLAVQPTFLSTLSGVAGLLRALCSETPTVPPPKLPLLDGQLRLHLAVLGGPGTLHEADAETRGLASGLAIEGELLHPGLRQALPPAWTALVPALPLARLLAALASAPGPARPPLAEAVRRAALYRFLITHEPVLFSDAGCREVLLRGRLLLSRGGQLLSVEELVLDPELPDLGVDWAPHAEVPAEVLQLLVRHLGAGQRSLLELARRHLRPAYVEAARRRDGALAARILGYLAVRFGEWQPEPLIALLCPAGEPLPVEDEAGSFRALHDVVVPRTEHAAPLRALFGPRCPLPSARYPAEVLRLLTRLGAAELPSLEQLRAVLRPGAALPGVLPSGVLSSEQALALASLLGALHEQHGPALVRELGLSELPWLLDGTQRPRRPPELYRPSPELELLIGTAPDLYPSPEVLGRLPESLLDELQLRGARDVQLPTVLRHLDHCERAQRPVSFRIYPWLERRLVQGQLDETLLVRELSGRRWICLDEGRYVSHTQVLGVVALRYFGSRRWAWERGAQECPRLCRLMGIPLSVTPEAVASFLLELGAEVRGRGDLALLATEPALPRMLLACYALLGRSGQAIARDLPVILCRASVPADPEHAEQQQRLLLASAPSLLRSDTPTLERLFQGAGTLHLAVAGPPEERDDIERFHAGLGIRRLRDAYTIAVDGAGGEDRSRAYAVQLQRLRSMLHALGTVLPRVRAQRTQLATAGWTFEARLRPLAESGALLALEPLRVRYRLDGVGEASAEVAAAYDPARGALLIDTEVLDDPLSYTSGLSQGVLPCVYDGPGEEQLLDIIEILLPLYTAARMNDYLDRRHFPTVGTRRKALERVTDRLLEILDYGLDAKLLARFPELKGARLASWRGGDVLRAFDELLPPGDERLSEELAVLAARHALLAAGVEAPTSGLVDELAELLRAASLSEVPARVLGASPPGTSLAGAEPDAPPEPLPRVDTRKREAEHMRWELAGLGQAVEREADGPPLRIGLGGPDEPLDIEPTSALGAALANALDGSGRPSVERRPPVLAEPGAAPERHVTTEPAPGAPLLPPSLPPSLPAATWSSAGDEDAEPPGLLSRMARFLGIGRPPPLPPVPTPGSLLGGNCMEPAQGIEPQLWATPGALRTLVRQPVLAQLRYTPPKLPAPYLYAVRALGGAFEAETQRWGTPRLDGMDFTKGLRPSGHVVIFEGQVAPGLSVLPRPLYSRLRAAPRLLDGTADQLDLVALPDGVQGVRVRGERPLRLHYEVELLEVGAVTQFRGNLSAPPQLLAPSLPLVKLPEEVQAFVAERRRLGGPAWEAALAVQGFVQWRYAYDLEFRTRPEVEAQSARLRPGRGNHHLQLLHAGADGTFLGRGTCFELNMLVVELLRHLGVPALLAGGWALDQGWIDRPDHSFGLAVVWSSSGPCLLPVDATKGPQGPRRLLPGIGEPAPLVAADGSGPQAQQGGGSAIGPGAPRVSAPPVPPVPGPWSADEVLPGPGRGDADGRSGAGRLDEALAELSAAEARHYLRDSELSLRALLLVCRKTGRAVPEEVTELARQPALPPTERAARLRAALELLLGDSEQAAALLLILRCGEQQVTVLSPALEALAGLGILQVRAVPQFQVSPAPEAAGS